MRCMAIAGMLGLALCGGALAHEPHAGRDALLGGIVQERDVGLVFGYLREALGAAIEGRDASPPEELTRRADAIGSEIKRRGAAAARAVIDAMERNVRESLREPRPALPPSYPPPRI